MSTTPSAAHQQFSASAPVSLTERRKAETRMEIARAAGALFVRQGLRGTRAEDIAQAAGIAPRTFYRYFATKEEAVAPLYAAGAQRWAEAVRAAPAHLSVPEALEHAVRHTLTPGLGVSAASWEWVRTLIRLADTSPALRKVWAEVCQTSETTLAEILTARAEHGPTGDEGREASAEDRAMQRGGGETSGGGREAWGEDLTASSASTEPALASAGSGRTSTGAALASAGSDQTTTGSALMSAGSDRVSAGLDQASAGSDRVSAGSDQTSAGSGRASAGSGRASAGSERASTEPALASTESGRTSAESALVSAPSVPTPAQLGPVPTGSAPAPSKLAPTATATPAGPTPLAPALRFTAAVAGAAVRVAVESWAATSAPPTGPEGPAALALHNLGALKGFDWGGDG